MAAENTPQDTTTETATSTETPLQANPVRHTAPVPATPPALETSDRETGAGNLNVTVLNHAGNPLAWTDGMKVRVTSSYLDTGRMCCIQRQDCPDDIQPQGDFVTFALTVEPRRAVMINAEIKYTPQGEWLAFEPLLTSLECAKPADVTLKSPVPASITRRQDKTQVIIEGRLCTSKARQDDTNKVEFEQVTARSTAKSTSDPANKAAQASNISMQAVLVGNQAYLSLPPGEYEMSIKTRDHFARSSPRTPFHLQVGTQDVQYPIWFEPCERTVTLMFVDACGQPVSGVELEVKDEGLLGPSNEQGILPFTPSRTGTFHISSRKLHVKPDVLHVNESRAQAHVFEVVARSHQRVASSDLGMVVLDLVELLEEDQIAIVKLLSLEGKMLDTQEAKKSEPARFNAQYDFPILLEAFVNGKPICQLIHQPHGS